MKYSNEFKKLLDNPYSPYIGHGNPNAKILLIGQEPAIDPEVTVGQWTEEILDNAVQWKKIVAESIGYDAIDHTKIEFGLPLHPWANQQFQVRSEMKNGNIRGEKGTARTWYNYQKLVNKIFELYSNDRKPMTKDDYLDFHRLSFHTDMSDSAFLRHSTSMESHSAVLKRVSLLSGDFFRNIPIIIAAVGHFPRDTYGDTYFSDIFGGEFIGNEETEPNAWINVSIRKDKDNPMLLIHTPQFSDAISDRYLDEIAKRVVDFANEHKINLMPEE